MLCTPFKSYYDTKPDLQYLNTFGSWVCVKRTGNRHAKLDRHDFSGIFLGYTSTDQNIIYLDLDLGLVKRSHHATFDKAWYLQPSCPLAAQLLYDLGLEAETIPVSDTGLDVVPLPVLGFLPESAPVPWPPTFDPSKSAPKWDVPFSTTHVTTSPLGNSHSPPYCSSGCSCPDDGLGCCFNRFGIWYW